MPPTEDDRSTTTLAADELILDLRVLESALEEAKLASIATDLVRIGFNANNILQFSVQTERYPGSEHSDKQTIANDLWDLSNRTSGGCLVYFTSHGSPDGIVLGEDVMSPSSMAAMSGPSGRSISTESRAGSSAISSCRGTSTRGT